MQSKKRKREKKVSMEQKQIYCSYLEENPVLARRKHCDASVQGLWQELAGSLKSTGGAQHTCEKWKSVFDNWRYSVTHKLRSEKSELKKTGGGPPTTKSSVEWLEERAMAFWGKIVVEGHSQVAVVGCSNFPKEAEQEELGDICIPNAYFEEPSGSRIAEVEELVEEVGGSGSAQAVKRPRKSAPKNLDNDVNVMLETSEANRQAHADAIVNRLDQIVVAIDSLAASQMAIVAAMGRIAEALSAHCGVAYNT